MLDNNFLGRLRYSVRVLIYGLIEDDKIRLKEGLYIIAILWVGLRFVVEGLMKI